MLKLLATDAVISKGYDNKPPLRFYDTEHGPIVRFRIGKMVFDSRFQDNRRWINLNAKASGAVCERIKKMKLKEGSVVNIAGRYDEEIVKGENDQKPRKFPLVIVEEIEYCHNMSRKDDQDDPKPDNPGATQDNVKGQVQNAEQTREPPTPPPTTSMPDNFSGFDSLDGADNLYF